MANYPLMDLSKLNKSCILGCEVYFDKSTDDFVLNSFLEFLQNVKKDFPQTLRNFDKFLILPNEFCTQRGQPAYYRAHGVWKILSCLCSRQSSLHSWPVHSVSQHEPFCR